MFVSAFCVCAKAKLKFFPCVKNDVIKDSGEPRNMCEERKKYHLIELERNPTDCCYFSSSFIYFVRRLLFSQLASLKIYFDMRRMNERTGKNAGANSKSAVYEHL